MNREIRLLIVEDSEDDARLAVIALRRGGYQPTFRRVQDAPGLRQALAEESWDAVLADFSMPRFSGIEALNIFRTTDQDIPFIFVSGVIGEETAVAAMKAGASDYVMKQNLARLAPTMDRELEQAAIRMRHRQALTELKRSHDRYMDLYNFAPVGYLTLARDGTVVQLNLTCATMLGSRRSQLRGVRFREFIAQQDQSRWDDFLPRALEGGERHSLELSLRTQGGEPLSAQIDCVLVLAGNKEPMLRSVLMDISARKQAEAELRSFETQLRQAQKMQSIGTLAGGIAHDFNNILGAVLGNVDLARGELQAGHAATKYLDEICKASLRARNLVRQILTFSRREPQELVTQPLRPVIDETLKLLRATLPAAVELHLRLSDAPLYVRADATQIQQVLMNLCTNAWHALREGSGRIEISLEPIEVDRFMAQHLSSIEPGPYAHLCISDNGTGMDSATKERIFEPFFTTKPVGRGTGLGLSVVHGIVTAHHGAIAVESEPGLGSRFRLFIPQVSVQAEFAPADKPSAEVPRGHGEHVMYVDDDETMLLVVERMLERDGYRVSAFQDAAKALEAVREHPEHYDFVVTDFNMPECSGLDVAEELARIRPDIPVVISSGYITEELRDGARRSGVRGLLEKQNTFQELGSLVGSILARRQG